MQRQLYISLDGQPLETACRLHLRGQARMTLHPTVFRLDFHSPSESILGLLSSARTLSVTSTFQSLLATGTILDVITQTVSGEPITTVFFADSASLDDAFISLSVPAGTTTRAAVTSILAASTVPLPLVAYTAADRPLPRPAAFFGSLADALQSLADDLHAHAFVFRSAVFMLGREAPATVCEIPSEDLLDAITSGREEILLTTTLKGWPIGSIVRAGDCTGRAITQIIDADTGEGPWFTKLILRRLNYD